MSRLRHRWTLRAGRGTFLSVVLMLLSLGLGPTANASQVDAQTLSDAQCAVVGMRLMQSTQAKKRMVGEMLTLYSLGQVEGRLRGGGLAGALKIEMKRMTPSVFKKAVYRCGTELSAEGAKITRIGRDMAQGN